MKRLTPDTRCALIRAYFLTSGNYTVRRSFLDASLNDVKYIASVFCSVNNWTLLDKSETKSKIWSAIIAAAVSLLTSIAQIFS